MAVSEKPTEEQVTDLDSRLDDYLGRSQTSRCWFCNLQDDYKQAITRGRARGVSLPRLAQWLREEGFADATLHRLESHFSRHVS